MTAEKSGEKGEAPADYIAVAREGQAVLLRVRGLGNMNISHVLNDFIETCLARHYRNYAIDLAGCRGMDSTFMGTLVGLETSVREAGGWLCLLNVSESNVNLLKMIGVWGLVPVKEAFPMQAIETQRLYPDRRASCRLRHIHQAHKNLVEIDERNRERFGAFLAGLEKEMGAQDYDNAAFRRELAKAASQPPAAPENQADAPPPPEAPESPAAPQPPSPPAPPAG